MLRGKIRYKYGEDGFGNPLYHNYDYDAVDNSLSLSGIISSGSYDALDFLVGDTEGVSFEALSSRRLDIGLSTYKVQTSTRLNEVGKLLKCPINEVFFDRISALIRYMKSNCLSRNEDGFSSLPSADGEFVGEISKSYTIPAGENSQILGRITLTYSEISALHLEWGNLKVDLENDLGAEMYVFRPIKHSTPKEIKLTSEVLGFEVLSKEKVNTGVEWGMYQNLQEVMENSPDKELEWLLDKEYHIVTDEMLPSLVDMFMATEGTIYFDTETTGLNITFRSRSGGDDVCVGIILSVEDGVSYYFPMQMKKIPNLCNGDHNYFMEHYMKQILENKPLAVHNASFDWKVCYIYNINANIVEDSYAMFKLTIGAEKDKMPMNLKHLARVFLGRDSLELSDLVVDNSWGESNVKFWDLPPELTKLYACPDTDNCRGLIEYGRKYQLLEKYNQSKIYKIEVLFSLAVGYQEFMGHMYDVTSLDVMRLELKNSMQTKLKQMEDILGYAFNPKSSIQLKKALYEDLGVPVQYNRKTGKVTTDKNSLKYLSEILNEKGETKFPFVNILRAYRGDLGVLNIVKQLETQGTSDGFVHSSVQQYGTTTGRLSIKETNYQSYNDIVKKYIRPRPNFIMFDTDYSSVEYRVLGNMAGNEGIKKGFKDPDFDYHAYQASRMFGVPYAVVSDALRKQAKSVNFALPYGMGDESLGCIILGEETPENTKKAKNLREKYFVGQDDIRDFFNTVRDGGVSNGYTETYFGRRRYYHRNEFTVAEIRRQAGNHVIQGTSADIYKLAVGRLFLRVCREGWLGKVLLTGFIHDEVLGEVHHSINPMVFLKALREEFEVVIEGWCPLYMGFGFGDSWYEAKKTEVPVQLQWEFVEKYGEQGYPEWDFNNKVFCSKIRDHMREYSIRHIAEHILDTTLEGQEIKPAIDKATCDVVKGDIEKQFKLYLGVLLDRGYHSQAFDTVCAGATDVKGVWGKMLKNLVSSCRLLDSDEQISSILMQNREKLLDNIKTDYTSSLFEWNGKILFNIFDIFGFKLDKFYKDTIEVDKVLDVFCKLYNIDRQSVTITGYKEEPTRQEDYNVSIENIMSGDDELEDTQTRMDARLNAFGVYLDSDEGFVYLRVLPTAFMDLIKVKCNVEEKGYKVILVNTVDSMKYSTQCYMTSEQVQETQSMYINYLSAVRSR